jgi:hypothetical protein
MIDNINTVNHIGTVNVGGGDQYYGHTLIMNQLSLQY